MEKSQQLTIYGNLLKMSNEILSIILLVYGTITLLLLINIEMKLSITKRVKCKFKKHSFEKNKEKLVKCEICGVLYKHPHIRVLKGGKY